MDNVFKLYIDFNNNSDLKKMYLKHYGVYIGGGFISGLKPDPLQDKIKYISKDSGLDLFFPDTITIPANSTVMIDLKVIVLLKKDNSTNMLNNFKYSPYLLLPRSSITKTPLRLANSIGLIDSGYRNTLKVVVDNIKSENYTIEKGTRLFQCVASDLKEFNLKCIKDISLLDTKSYRGLGGFGSTGI